MPIFPAREAPIPGVTHQLVLQSIADIKTEALDGQDFDHTGSILDRALEDGDVLITMGAGDVDRVALNWLGAANA